MVQGRICQVLSIFIVGHVGRFPTGDGRGTQPFPHSGLHEGCGGQPWQLSVQGPSCRNVRNLCRNTGKTRGLYISPSMDHAGGIDGRFSYVG